MDYWRTSDPAQAASEESTRRTNLSKLSLARVIDAVEATLSDAEAAGDPTAPLVYLAGAAALLAVDRTAQIRPAEAVALLALMARTVAVVAVAPATTRAGRVLETLVLPELLATLARTPALDLDHWRSFWTATARSVRAAVAASAGSDAARNGALDAGAALLAAVVDYGPADKLLASVTSVRRVVLTLAAFALERPARADAVNRALSERTCRPAAAPACPHRADRSRKPPSSPSHSTGGGVRSHSGAAGQHEFGHVRLSLPRAPLEPGARPRWRYGQPALRSLAARARLRRSPGHVRRASHPRPRRHALSR